MPPIAAPMPSKSLSATPLQSIALIAVARSLPNCFQSTASMAFAIKSSAPLKKSLIVSPIPAQLMSLMNLLTPFPSAVPASPNLKF